MSELENDKTDKMLKEIESGGEVYRQILLDSFTMLIVRIEKLEAENERLKKAQTLQSMESVPKKGTHDE